MRHGFGICRTSCDGPRHRILHAFKSAVGVSLVLIAACAHGLEDDATTSDPFASGSAGATVGPTSGGNQAGSSTSSTSGGGAGSDGFGGSAGTSAASGGNAGTNLATGGSGGSAGTSVASGGSAGAGNAGTGGSGGDARDGGDGDVASEATPGDAAPPDADASCVAESAVAFCLRLRKNCGNTTAADNCGNTTTNNCGTCGTLQMCGGGGTSIVCGSLTTPQGGTVTSSSPGVTPEDMTKAFDGTTATKWYAGNGVKTGWIAYQFTPAATHRVTAYSISSANDVPGRDPSAWQLQGSNDGQAWTTVDTRTGEVFANRLQTNNYTCTSPGDYSHYRLNITANSGGTDLQLSELQLFGR